MSKITPGRVNNVKEKYLGDGLYASDDGYMITLRALREDGDHWIGLESPVISALMEFIEKSREVKITVTNHEFKQSGAQYLWKIK